MEYVKYKKYDTPELAEKMMGPNPLKLTEELLRDCRIASGATVLDLGSGQGLTSVFLAREYGFKVYAGDLWSEPEDNQKFFDSMGVPRDRLIPVKADAQNLPFEKDFFDGVVSIDSYNYFGRDKSYLDEKLLPFVKSGGYIYIVIPGMVRDVHDAPPPELLLSWNLEQLDYIHDLDYWRGIVTASRDCELIDIFETEGNTELWDDWLRCDNEYAREDRRAMDAGAGKYLNFVAMVLRKK